jgi:hypothetical protein
MGDVMYLWRSMSATGVPTMLLLPSTTALLPGEGRTMLSGASSRTRRVGRRRRRRRSRRRRRDTIDVDVVSSEELHASTRSAGHGEGSMALHRQHTCKWGRTAHDA